MTLDINAQELIAFSSQPAFVIDGRQRVLAAQIRQPKRF